MPRTDAINQLIAALLGEDILGVVVRTHIHIEARLNALLEIAVPHPSLLPNLRYEQRLRLACALGLHERWFKQLKLLGDIRNKFGHRIDADLTEEMVSGLEYAFDPQDLPGFLAGVQAANPEISTFEEFRKWPPKRRFVMLAVGLDKMLEMAAQEFMQHDA